MATVNRFWCLPRDVEIDTELTADGYTPGLERGTVLTVCKDAGGLFVGAKGKKFHLEDYLRRGKYIGFRHVSDSYEQYKRKQRAKHIVLELFNGQ